MHLGILAILLQQIHIAKSNQATRIFALRDVRQVETLARMLRALGAVVADFLRGVAEVSIRAVVHALE